MTCNKELQKFYIDNNDLRIDIDTLVHVLKPCIGNLRLLVARNGLKADISITLRCIDIFK